MARFGVDQIKVRGTVEAELFNKIAISEPLFNRPCPLFDSSDISDEYGSGIEPICPAHDVASVVLAGEYNLPIFGYLDKNGMIEKSLGEEYVGISCLGEAGNDLITQKLQERTLWISKGENKYYLDKKTNSRVVLRTCPAWNLKFPINTRNKILRELALKEFVPELDTQTEGEMKSKLKKEEKKKKKLKPQVGEIRAYRKTFFNSFIKELELTNDLCISENNPWSIPIPCFADKKTGDLVIDQEIIAHIAKVFANKGSDSWYLMPISDLLPDSMKAKSNELTRVWETFDSSFVGSLVHYFLNSRKGNKKRPDAIIEGYDQHERWIPNVAVVGSLLSNSAPFHLLKTHGMIIDEVGTKISPINNNPVYPVNIIDGSTKIGGERQYGMGTDALRAWVSANDTDSDIYLKEVHLDTANKKLKDMRIVFEKAFFALSKADLSEKKGVLIPDSLPLIDQYLLHKLTNHLMEVYTNYEKFTYSSIFESLSKFVENEVNDYVQTVSYSLQYESFTPKSKQTAMILSKLLNSVAIAMHPILPYTSAEIIDNLDTKTSLLEQMRWPELHHELKPTFAYNFIDNLYTLKKDIRNQVSDLIKK